jgi:4-hydroxy-tetrahydrodipicolinate synthase
VYVAGGGSGEAYTLSKSETKRVLEIGAEELKGRVPVRGMGKEPRTAKEMIEFAKMVEAAGLDGMQLYSLDAGHGSMPARPVLERYLTDVLEATSVPTIISTHMSVGYYIPVDLLAELCDRYPHIIGINVTNPDIRYLISLLDLVGSRVETHVGGPMQGLTALAIGATGYLSSEANIAPKLAMSVINHWKARDLEKTADTFDRLLRLFHAGMLYGGAKTANRILGVAGGYPRRPRLAATEESELAFAKVLDELDIRKIEGM